MKDFQNHAYLDDVAMAGDHDKETISKAWKLKDTVSPAFFNVTKFKSYPPQLTEPFDVAARNDPFKLLGLGFDPITDSFFIKSRKLDEYRQKEQNKQQQYERTNISTYSDDGTKRVCVVGQNTGEVTSKLRTLKRPHPLHGAAANLD